MGPNERHAAAAAGLRLLGVALEPLVAALGAIETPVLVAGADGRHLWGNEGFERLAGCTALDAVGRPLVEVRSGPGREGVPHPLTLGFALPDGTSRLLDLHASPLAAQGGEPGHWVLVAAGTRLEGGEVATEGTLLRLIASLEEHVYSCELAPDGRFVEVYRGPASERFLGRAALPSDDPEESWLRSVHPDDLELCRGVDERLARCEPVELEYRMLHPDGSVVWAWERMFPRRAADGRIVVDGIVTDVTERRRMLDELAEAHDRLARVVEAADEYFYTVEQHSNGRLDLHYSGPGRSRMLGRDGHDERSESELHDAWIHAIHPDDRDRIFAAVETRSEESGEFEYRLVGEDGVLRWVSDRYRPRRDAEGRLYFDGVVSDITERRRLAADMLAARDSAERRSRTDDLTGIANRRHFGEVLSEALERRDGRAPGVLLVDVDRFKQVNDRHGHTVGDQVLVELAARLRRRLRGDDRIARWGGEEIVVLVADAPDDAALRRIADSLRRAAEERPFDVGGVRLAVTVSVGASRAHDAEASGEQLLHEADQALYAAKRAGRNRACLASQLDVDPFTEPEGESLARALSLQASLREGMPPLHPEHVAELAGKVALHLGLPPALVQRCRLGGLLHDIGKIAVPDRILAKPGALTPEELATMRMHSEMGEQMARHIAGLSDATLAIRHHHERFDGTGYPDRLAGHAIPVEARILAAADAFSAMTCRRVYSPARERESAIRELRAQRGRHFDPQVVDALLAVLEEEHREAGRRLGGAA